MWGFTFWRHHLQNEANRRIIAHLPTPAEQERIRLLAEESALGPITGVRCTAGEWAAYVHLWLPQVETERDALREMFAKNLKDASTPESIAEAHSGLARMKRPVTWQTLTAAARRQNRKGLRPPRSVEKALRNGTCSLDGSPISVLSPGTASNSRFAR